MSFYKKKLEEARKQVVEEERLAKLDGGDSKFGAPNAAEQKAIQQEGLMRPKARPGTGGEERPTSLGMKLMRQLAQGTDSGTHLAPDESVRPKARPGSGDEGRDDYDDEGPIRPVPRPGTVGVDSLSDKEILALTLQAEAGGEGYEGMIAAGAVIANRAASGKYGKGISGVIMKPGQFSAWNGVTGYAGGEGAIDMDRVRPSKAALKAAEAILSGNYKDVTGGATHYYNPSVASPAWGGEEGNGWKDIGNHRFGKA